MKRVLARLSIVTLLLPFGGCSSDTDSDGTGAGAPTDGFSVVSTAFAERETIPLLHTEDGDDTSPPLSWSGAPDGTKQFAVVCDDPDAGMDPWVHWVLYHVPAATTSLPAGIGTSEELTDPITATQGNNSWPTVGYRGPAPPQGSGPHRYVFHVYALDAEIELEPGATRGALDEAMKGHILDEAKLTGIYER